MIRPGTLTDAWCNHCKALRPWHCVAHGGTHCTVCQTVSRSRAAVDRVRRSRARKATLKAAR